MKCKKDILVLLSTYNGSQFLEEQINSIVNQKGVDVKILARDDGSKDGSLDILRSFPEVEVINGQNLGAGKSFYKLIELSNEYEYYAFADQDDIWDDDKLFTAVQELMKYEGQPALYCSNTRLVDSCGNFIFTENKKPVISLESAFIKNYATGCTIVFNNNLMNVIKRGLPQKSLNHDWWLNLVCLSIGGISIFDPIPHISYRQHGNNVEGADTSIIKKTKKRLHKYIAKRYHRETMAKEILDAYSSIIPEENNEILKKIADYKIKFLLSGKFDTGSLIDNFLFKICVVTRRI